MKYFLAFTLFALFPMRIYAWWPFTSPTPTPTPTPILIQNLQMNPDLLKIVTKATPAPTTTLTPTAGITSTTAPTVTITTAPTSEVIPTETIEVSPTIGAGVEETPQPEASPAAGFTNREIVYGASAIILFLIIIVQANWTKIKTWLHNKTA